MTHHSLVLYHHTPLIGSTVKGNHHYAYHTHERGDDSDSVRISRENLCKHLNFSYLITLFQTHSSVIYRITEENLKDFLANPLIQGDGLWTTLPDVLLGVFTADCLPVFFWAKDALGVVHAGRRGVDAEIHLRLAEEFLAAGYRLDHIHVLIGPHIRECCYEVGEEILQKKFSHYAIKRFDHWYLNLEAKVLADLHSIGITHIQKISLCTMCSDERLWYSYRRGEKHARHLHFIGRKK